LVRVFHDSRDDRLIAVQGHQHVGDLDLVGAGRRWSALIGADRR